MYCNFCGAALQAGVAQCPSCGSLTPYRAQEPDKVVHKPLSLQQSGERQIVQGNAAPPPSKLSDYKPTGSSGSKAPPQPPALNTNTARFHSASMPGIAPGSKLAQYSQAPGQPGKLSDYKQPTIQRSKLSDYKASVQPPVAPNYIDISSMPTAGPASFNTAATPPAPGVPPSPFIAPVTPPASGIQPVYPPAANMASASKPVNPPSAVPAAGHYAPNPALQVGAPPTNAPRRGKQGGVLMGAIAIILLIVCIGAASLFFLQRTNTNNSVATVTKTAIKPLPTIAPIHGPSGNISVPAVSALFSKPQMTARIDSNDRATQITNTFTSGQTIYVTFSLNSKDQPGYVSANWYKGKQLFREVEFAHDPSKTNGYFSVVYDTATTDGSVEIYWSTTASLSDAKLAWVAHFTVSK